MLRGGVAFVDRAQRIAEVRDGKSYQLGSGLWEAAELARAVALRPDCLGVRKEMCQVKSGHDAARARRRASGCTSTPGTKTCCRRAVLVNG